MEDNYSPEEFLPGDRVTLNERGLEFFETRRFPPQIGALYTNILGDNTEVLRTEGEYVRLRMRVVRFPATEAERNDFGVTAAHLKKRRGRGEC